MRYSIPNESHRMKKHVALITYRGLPNGAASELLLLPHLATAHVEAEFVDWRTACDFSRFELVILRSCWDYHLHSAEFDAWLRHVANTTPVLNEIKTVLWNRSKFYLRELMEKGIAIAPAVFVAAGEVVSAKDRERIASWQKVVVKPAVSASAHNTWLTESSALPAQVELARQMQGEAFLVQQFIPEIQSQGEISFVYMDGRYSHAVLKSPAAGNFRVQQEHGGSSELFVPSSFLLEQVDAIAHAVPQVRNSLYCRVDVVDRAGKLLLMELELIEPELYLNLAEGAAAKLAAAIVKRIS
jgi:glutathione synthase/RimK-type ligase-like ATP-grasp enzyme